MNIALLGNEQDPQIQHVSHALFATGYTPFIVNTAYFGTRWQLSYDPDYDDGLLHFDYHKHLPSNRIAMSNIHAVYWHQYERPILNATTFQHKNWLASEHDSALMCWLQYTGTRWVNSIDAVRAHQCKPHQLKTACQLGATIPYTCIGNASRVAKQFCNNMDDVIHKPVRGGKTATLLRKEDDNLHYVSSLVDKHPVTLQAFIPGTNIRSYVLGDDVISVQIDSLAHDFRDDDAATPLLTPLPKSIQQLAKTLCKGLGMKWCAIDWRRNHKGEYFFLEANPCPFFLRVEREVSVDITGRLLKLLTQG